MQQIAELQRLTGLDHLVTEFAFGGLPHEEAEVNMRLFANRVMPILQRDAAFRGEPVLSAPGEVAPKTKEDMFAPA